MKIVQMIKRLADRVRGRDRTVEPWNGWETDIHEAYRTDDEK